MTARIKEVVGPLVFVPVTDASKYTRIRNYSLEGIEIIHLKQSHTQHVVSHATFSDCITALTYVREGG